MADDRLLNDPGFNSLLQRRLNISSAPSAAMAPEIFPVFPVHDFPPDLEYLIQRRRCAGVGAVAAVAAQFSHVALFNPNNSQTLVTCRGIMVSAAVGDVSLVMVSDLVSGSPGGTQNNTFPLDTRWAQTQALAVQTTANILTGSNAALVFIGKEVARFNPTATTQGTFFHKCAITLRPFSSLYIVHRTANTGFTVNYEWTERAVQPGEL